MHENWKKAVIHLECAGNEYPIYRLIDEFRAGTITREQYEERMSAGNGRRYRGTAIYLTHQGRRYLVSSRHVLNDEEEGNTRIFSYIFYIPSFNQASQSSHRPPFMMNLGAGVPWDLPFTFSDTDIDLAVISLETRSTSSFADYLNRQGHEPIDSSLIAQAPTEEGADIFSVGYPSTTSDIATASLHPAEIHWASSAISLPIFSFGKVAMLNENLPFFIGDLSIYAGNSGGPIIENNTLVGVVAANYVEPIDGSDLEIRIPYAKLIKALHIIPLLEEQASKDAGREPT
jgi:hypothetical protein